MPKRIIDFEAGWSSATLAQVKEEFIPEYFWLYGLADANGNFEIDNLRVIHGKVAAIRPHFTIEQLREILAEFKRVGLMYTWKEEGREYAHWTKSNFSGRQPALSQRNHHPMLKVKAFRDLKNQAAMDAFYAEVARYMQRCRQNLRGDAQQRLLAEPVEAEPVDLELLADTNAVAAARADEAVARGYELDPRARFWREFWQLYPGHRRGNEARTRELFFALGGPLQCSNAVDMLKAWKASDEWKNPKYIPMSDNGFFTDARFKELPAVHGKETDNGQRRGFGPTGRTAEDKFRRNLETLQVRGLLKRS